MNFCHLDGMIEVEIKEELVHKTRKNDDTYVIENVWRELSLLILYCLFTSGDCCVLGVCYTYLHVTVFRINSSMRLSKEDFKLMVLNNDSFFCVCVDIIISVFINMRLKASQ